METTPMTKKTDSKKQDAYILFAFKYILFTSQNIPLTRLRFARKIILIFRKQAFLKVLIMEKCLEVTEFLYNKRQALVFDQSSS